MALAKSGSNLPFKSITAGTGITLTSAANELQISSDSGEVNTSSNSGTGEGLALAKSGNNLPFKSITAGTGITLTSAANELQISSAGGTDTNIGNADLTQTDLNRIYTRSAISGVSRLRFQGSSHILTLEDSSTIVMYSSKYDTGGTATPTTALSGSKLEFNGGTCRIQGAGSELRLHGYYNTTIESKINLSADLEITSKSTRKTIMNANILRWESSDSVTHYGNINNGKFIWATGTGFLPPTVVGSEGISLQKDTLVKGSDNAAATSGFKVTDVNNLSLLDVKNNGALKLQYLPSLPAGTVAGDLWSQNGTLRIGNPTANIQTEVSASTITPNIDTTKLIVTSALAAALTIAAPTGTPQEGQELTFRFKDDGTARALTWNAIFEDYTGSLPTTTTAGKTVYIGCKYNLINTKWDVVAVQTQP